MSEQDKKLKYHCLVCQAPATEKMLYSIDGKTVGLLFTCPKCKAKMDASTIRLMYSIKEAV